jgi:zinc and cadmium transporter
MIWIFFLLLFIASFCGSAIPFLFKEIKSIWMTLLLAFSGSFLLGITMLHLMPESFHELPHKAGMYILFGFFFQLLLQRFSHGVEHGHVHEHKNGEQVHAILPIFLGLSIHAFMEGIPLGFNYQATSTIKSVFLGVAAHKLPEAITLGVLLKASKPKQSVWIYLFAFAIMSPLAGVLAVFYGQKFYFITSILTNMIPIVIGAFLHIATTILYESGTKHHELSKQKVIFVLLGIAAALLTLLFH